jgi:hypothetical protein
LAIRRQRRRVDIDNTFTFKEGVTRIATGASTTDLIECIAEVAYFSTYIPCSKVSFVDTLFANSVRPCLAKVVDWRIAGERIEVFY